MLTLDNGKTTLLLTMIWVITIFLYFLFGFTYLKLNGNLLHNTLSSSTAMLLAFLFSLLTQELSFTHLKSLYILYSFMIVILTLCYYVLGAVLTDIYTVCIVFVIRFSLSCLLPLNQMATAMIVPSMVYTFMTSAFNIIARCVVIIVPLI